MITVLKSLFNTIYGAVKWFINFLQMASKTYGIIGKILLFITDFLYLVPVFLASFAMVYMVIFIVNRILNGRN